MMDINLVSKKLVKPCTPTPQNLKTYKLSFIDKIVNQMDNNFGVLLFYTPPNEKQMIINLELSLSKVLVQFYPLSGRCVVKDCYIDCSDQGVEFVEAEAPTVELANLTRERDLENLVGLYPRNNHQIDELTYPLLSIQVTHLGCGGLAVGIKVAHVIFDASSLGTFIAAWSNASKCYPWGDTCGITPILDVSSSIFPLKFQENQPKLEKAAEGVFYLDTSRVSVKRFTFNKEAIDRVRSGLRPKQGDRGWSKVLVVSAVIAKAMMGVTGSIFVSHVVNHRERTVPPLPKHACGNFGSITFTQCMDDMGVQELVDVMSQGIDKTLATCAQMLSLDEDKLIKVFMDPLMNIFEATGKATTLSFSDWSKFGFYEADFGWGKPAWVGSVTKLVKDLVVLMANKEGNGIEAWLYLEKNEMALFEQDEEIKLLAT